MGRAWRVAWQRSECIWYKSDLMTRDEIQAVYATGPEAVIALVEALLARIAALEAEHVRLMARIKALEDRLAVDSHNSHQPPSGDRGRPAPRSQRPSSGRRPGGQAGHPGRTLRLVEVPDRREVHRPTQCRECGGELDGGAERLDAERRQVVDLPPLRLEVVEHRVAHVTCPGCGRESSGRFPAGVSEPVQYGERLKALGVYLHDYQLLPYARTSELLADLFGAAPSEGTLQATELACSGGLLETEAAIKAAIQQAPVGHFDESSVRVNGHREWLHVSSTTRLTHYGVHPKRGRAATDELGILPGFSGRAVHDGWAPYATYTECTHALCNAHHLRELTFVHEQHQQTWAKEMKDLLVTIKQRVEQAQAVGATGLDDVTLAAFEQEYERLLADGLAANPPPAAPAAAPPKRGRKKQSKAKNLLDRLTDHRQQVLAFMYDCRVPFDNNLAERDLRMLKVQQKIAGGFRSSEGAAAFARIRGYISTLRKQGLPVLQALERLVGGTPVVPSLSG